MRTRWACWLVLLVLPPASAEPGATGDGADHREVQTDALSFSDACGDWMVLQQAPARATVAGTLNASTSAAAPVSVSVCGGSVNYTVQATLTKITPEPDQARTVTLARGSRGKFL
jgi:hypothetical protein